MTKAEDNENRIVAQRYAQALLEFAGEGYTKEQILADISDISESYLQSEDLQKVMTSPVISQEDKKTLLIKIFKEVGVNEIILNFLKLLVDKNRFNIFSAIVKEYKNEINRMNNLLGIRVVSAIDLTDSEKAMIKVKLEKNLGKEIELDWAVDNDIIGGLLFESGDNIVDCSLRKKLQDINKEITI